MPKDHVRIELAALASLRQGGGAGRFFFELEWSTMPRDVAQGLKCSVLLPPKLLKRRKIDRCSHVHYIRATNDSVGTVSLSRDH
jgi:hypothetical protein